MSMDVSVVVPTYKRQATLDCCLEALLHLERKGFCYEILIVDNAASAQTRQQVERWIDQGACRGVPIRYLATTQKGPAAARNLGWHESGGRIIAFTDDDCIPDPRWLQAGLAAFHADVEAV